MMMFRRNFRLLLAGLCFCTLMSCEATQEVWLDDMQGTLDYNIPLPMGKSQQVVFIAGGIATPSQGIVYEWQAPGFVPSTFTGQSFATTTPADAGSYPVTVTVKSTGYRAMSTKKMVSIQPCLPLSGVVDFSVSAPVVAGFPVIFTASGVNSDVGAVAYIWDAPDFTPSTYEGNTFNSVCPPVGNLSAAKDYQVTVTATADGYCSMDTVKTVTVQPCLPLPGELDFSVSTPVTVGLPVTFTASGIDGDVGAIAYTWNAPDFTPSTYEGRVFNPKSPGVTTNKTVTLTATVDGYCPASVSKPVVVNGGQDMKVGSSFEVKVDQPTIYVGKQVTFRANFKPGGSNPPATDKISYLWECAACEPDFFQGDFPTGQSYKATIIEEGSYTIRVTASAPGLGFHSVDTTYSFESVCQPLTDNGTNLAIAVVPTPMVTGGPVTFEVTGVKSDIEAVTYTWSTPQFVDENHTGNTFSTICPPVGGTYQVTVKVDADNYCSKEISKSVEVINGHAMEGTLAVSASHSTIYLGQEVTFSATGITAPVPVTYNWHCENCTPSTYIGEEYKTKVPLIAGDSYTVNLRASADNHVPKDASYTFATVCKSMPATDGFDVSPGFNVRADQSMTFTAPNSSLSGTSYTWNFNTDKFIITSGNTVTATVFVTAPSEQTDPLPVTLTMNAPGYCPTTYTKNISVANCEPMLTPDISPKSSVFQSYTKYEFTSTDVGALPSVKYEWKFLNNGFTPQSGTGKTFVTTAPAYMEGNSHELELTVTATSYCTQKVSRIINIQSFSGSLNGTVEVRVKRPTYTTDYSTSVWLAENKQVVLEAFYDPTGTGEESNDVIYDWYLVNDSYPLTGSTLTSVGTNGAVTYTPPITPGITYEEQQLVIRVRAKNKPLAPKYVPIPMTVQDCDYSDNDLFISAIHQCKRLSEGTWEAYIIDAVDQNIYRTIQMPGNSRWWTAENLRKKYGVRDEAKNNDDKRFGIFYQYHEEMADNAGKYCPKGWRIPTESEWKAIITGTDTQNGLEGIAIKSTNHVTTDNLGWYSQNDMEGTDTYKFTAYPTGIYNTDFGNSGYKNQTTEANFLLIGTNVANLRYQLPGISFVPRITSPNPVSFYPIRCIKGEKYLPPTP